MADYSALYEQAGKQFNVDPQLIAAVVQNESSGNPNAVSPQGAEGLGQLMPATAKSVGVTNPKDPKQNIFGTAQVLAQNLDHYGNVDDAIRAYHGGWDQKNWGPKTESYHAKVTSTYGSTNPVSDSGQDVYAMWGIAPSGKGDGSVPAHEQDPYAFWGAESAASPKISSEQPSPQAESDTRPSSILDDPEYGPIAKGLINAGHGVVQGIRDIPASLDPVAQYLDKHVGSFTAGGLLPTAEQAHASNVSARNAFEKKYGKSVAAAAGRIGGNILTTAPVMGLAGKGVNALAQGAKAIVPAVAPLADFVAGAPQAGMLARYAQGGLQGAAQGGLGAALLSSQSNAPVGQQIQQGAEFGGLLGAAAPAVYDAGRFAGNGIRHFVAPYTEAGRNQLAEHVITDFAGGNPALGNANEIVPGSIPTMAEATGNPGIATLQRTIRDIEPGQFTTRAQRNSAARNALLGDAAGTSQDIESAISARDQQARQQLNSLFANTGQTNAQPIVDTIDNILQGPSGKRPAVHQAMSDVRNMLVDKNGNAVSDPQTLYDSVRKGIGDLLDKKDLSKAYGKQAASQLLQVQDALDDTIESAAPGFKNYLSDYAKASQPINSMEYLQGLNLTDQNGNITLSKVQNAIRDLGKKQAASGISKAKAVGDVQLDALKSIRDDLLRAQYVNAGKSLGSNTAQNLAAQASLNRLLPGKTGAFVEGAKSVIPTGLGVTLGGAAGTAIGGPVGGIAGAGVGAGLGNVYRHAQQANNAAILSKIENMLLNPQLYTGATPPPLAIERAANSPAARAVIPLAIPAALSANRLFGNTVSAQ